jgi:hypothetical protein
LRFVKLTLSDLRHCLCADGLRSRVCGAKFRGSAPSFGVCPWGHSDLAGIAHEECSHAQTGICWLAVCWDGVGKRWDFGSCLSVLVLPRVWLRVWLCARWLWLLTAVLPLLLSTKILWCSLLSSARLWLGRLGPARLGMGQAALGLAAW